MTVRYSEEIGAEICRRVADGEPLDYILRGRKPHLARHTVWRWRQEMPEFAAAYEDACRCGADKLAEEVITIADELPPNADGVMIAKARLQTDVRRWKATKLLSEVYGDRVALTGKGGSDLIPAENQATRIPRLMAVLAVAMPGKDNSELFEMATRMIARVDGLAVAPNGHDPG